LAPRLVIDRRTLRLMLLAFLLLAGLTLHRLYLAEPPPPTEALLLQGETMGTTWEIRIAGKGLDPDLRERARAETERRLADIDRWMSTWNPESEISRFNADDGRDPFPVSFETAEVVDLALEVGRASEGAFDVTVGPLVALWGFGSGARAQSTPDDDEIEALRRHIGPGTLEVDPGDPDAGGLLRKREAEVRIDLSGIAKGYGVDHVARGLRALGREDFLVEIGGEIRAAGERPGGGSWRVAIEQPLDHGRAIQEVIALSDRAMATSGDYRIFYREDGRRVSHTLDPRTGRPVDAGTASATVLAPDCATADAWATALLVLGPDPGLELARSEGLAAMLLIRDPAGGFREVRNELFPETISP